MSYYTTTPYAIQVTFVHHSKVLGKTFHNVELHRSIADARLRAFALNWQIESIFDIKSGEQLNAR